METKSKSKGLAPFASVEDLSDEQESPGHEKHRLTLPGIKEDAGLKSPRSGPAAITPRIDISRASSSSHHDDSSPEREIFAGPGAVPGGTKLGLGFSEEMALELRSSTEELDFQDPADAEIKMKRKKLHQQHAVTKYDLDTQSEKDTKERKDSACSDIGLLSISGRTSRLSSIGSAASGGSGASRISGNSHLSSGSHLSGVSHMSGVSGASHLSGLSHVSGVSQVSGASHLSQLSKASRCSSPHRMLLETSFCGQKPIPTVSLEAEYPPEECVEAALLARKSDPTGAVLPPEGAKPFVNGNRRLSNSTSTLTVRRTSARIEHKSKSSSEGLSRTHSGKSTCSVPVPSRTKRHSSSHKIKLNEFEQIISLHGDDDVEDEKQSGSKTDQRLSPENGIYIPLKGPDIVYTKSTKHDNIKFDNQVKSRTSKSRTKPNQKHVKDEEMVKFVSLHADESKRKPLPVQTNQDEACLLTKNDLKQEKLKRGDVQPNVPTIQAEDFKPDELISDPSYVRKHSAGSCRSPEFEIAKVKPATLDLTGVVRPSRQSLTQVPNNESRTPSPAASLSKGSVFRRSSDSSSSSKSRISGVSGSSETKSRKDSRNRSSFTNLFKKGSKERTSGRKKNETSEKNFTADSRPKNIHVTYNHEDKIQDGDCIVIPLHSPDSVGEPVLMVADMEPDNFIEVHLVKTPSKSISLKSQDLTPASVIEVAAVTAQSVEPVGDVKLSIQTELKEEDKITSNLKQEAEAEAEALPVEVEVDVQSNLEVDVKEKSDISVNNTKPELADLLGSDKKLDPEKKPGSEERRSSGSEPDSDAVPLPNGEDDEHERKGLVHQAESVEDELPYVPTTLPQERSVAHPIVPIKQRVSEVKTCPIDRPRSTTPINPATLDDYVSTPHEEVATTKDKMQIILPRAGSVTKESRSKSPGKVKPWTHFAEQGLHSPRRTASPSPPTVTPPPLPPRSWVCFDELPERRRTPQRITTLPAPPNPQTTASNIVYNYVNPDECSCECHEAQGRVNGAQCSDRPGQCSATDKDKSSYRT